MACNGQDRHSSLNKCQEPLHSSSHRSQCADGLPSLSSKVPSPFPPPLRSLPSVVSYPPLLHIASGITGAPEPQPPHPPPSLPSVSHGEEDGTSEMILQVSCADSSDCDRCMQSCKQSIIVQYMRLGLTSGLPDSSKAKLT